MKQVFYEVKWDDNEKEIYTSRDKVLERFNFLKSNGFKVKLFYLTREEVTWGL